MECDNSIVKNVKHEEPTSEVGTSGSLNSDMLYHDDDDDDDDDDDEMMDNWDDVDDDFDLDYEGDYMFEILESDDESHYLSIQSRFDNINLPPGCWFSRATDSIFVRAYETSVDLLRGVIVGPAGTPYHDGLLYSIFTFLLTTYTHRRYTKLVDFG
ncbi:unnamed protein product [Lactuca saligna]|uniref:Uncharacterized protein n=1 Tax=Lactuca saligna TaxID=75948 RepID=A0AA35ZVB7_LACSI|nr:unnamed protein product [Lactuca saligna]